jgi:hypothetical protein
MKASDVLKKGSGYKGFLSVEVEGFVLNCPVKYERMSSKDVKEQHKVIFRDSKGREAERKYTGEGRHLEWRTKEGEVIDEEVSAYQNVKGKEVLVQPFKKSETIKIVKIVPHASKDNFLIEKTYEIWGDDEAALFKLADFLNKKKAVGLCSIVMTQGYDTQYLGIIEPRFVESGKFGILLYLTKKSLVFNHLLEAGRERRETATPIGLEIIEGVI